MAKEKVTILRRWFEEVWNKGNAELIDEMLAPECIAFGLNDPSATRVAIPSTGRKNSRNSFLALAAPSRISTSMCRKRFPTMTSSPPFSRITVTHKGEVFGMQATGGPITSEGMRKFRVRDGKVVEVWNRFDFSKTFQQMGVVTMGTG